MTGTPKLDLIKASVKVLDIFYWVNKEFRLPEMQIDEKEFTNDTINEGIDLSAHLIKWAQRAHVRHRNEY